MGEGEPPALYLHLREPDGVLLELQELERFARLAAERVDDALLPMAYQKREAVDAVAEVGRPRVYHHPLALEVDHRPNSASSASVSIEAGSVTVALPMVIVTVRGDVAEAAGSAVSSARAGGIATSTIAGSDSSELSIPAFFAFLTQS